MNPPGFFRLLALLWVAATMARRCGRRSTALPESFLEESSNKAEGKSTSYNPPKGCGMTSDRERITGGEEAAPESSPWTVSVQTKLMCGGSIVTDRHVVTAAHCVVNTSVETVYEPSYFTVHVGSQNLLDNDSVVMSVESVWPHEGYVVDNDTYYNDIAILVLVQAIAFGLTASPVCLPYAFQGMDLAGRKAVVVGWGDLEYNGSSSDQLMSAKLTIIDQEMCRIANNEEFNITRVHICAATFNNRKDTCQGDSGGPLVMPGPDLRINLVGVVSFGKPCGQTLYPAVYVRVTEFLDWIDARLRGQPPPQPSFV